MNGMDDKEEDGNAGHEYERVSSEHEVKDGNCEDTEAETYGRNGEHSETGEVK
jgi:hypothetical protein